MKPAANRGEMGEIVNTLREAQKPGERHVKCRTADADNIDACFRTVYSLLTLLTFSGYTNLFVKNCTLRPSR